ncbi:unnamed protein product [Linum tenue]|nr:unnamed protein product [Linum tenue]CAI0458210.1 unnamed protein product [Linum tenue]CAI0458338.1 unnamed protein product [Linum tenue]CAI0554704.1 unnamed protein product [Linum tenue]
MGHLRG